MPEFVTFGETMAVFSPSEIAPLRYCRDFKLRIAGAESNTAIGLAKLGHSAGWVSSLGDDEIGAFVLNSIRSEGVDVSNVTLDQHHRTGLMVKQLSSGETSVFYYRENSAASKYTKSMIDFEYFNQSKIIHLTGITPVLSRDCRDATLAIVDFALKNNKVLSFDPNIRLRLWWDNDYTDLICKIMFSSQIVMLGLDEAVKLLGTDKPEKIRDIFVSEGVQRIAVKDGANGVWCADDKNLIHIKPHKCRPVDPVGAGDGFNSGFISGILKGESLEICGKMGAISGAMATETSGDVEGYPTQWQMQSKLAQTEMIYR